MGQAVNSRKVLKVMRATYDSFPRSLDLALKGAQSGVLCNARYNAFPWLMCRVWKTTVIMTISLAKSAARRLG